MSKDNFEQYVISEFKVDNQAAVEIKYTHNISIKKAVINHMITMNLKFYDKNVKLLKTCTLKFLNNVIAPSYAKKLININPGELNNKFMAAKNDIINIIKAEYEEKRNELDEKINELDEKINQLNEFGKGQFGIEDQFRGELVKVKENRCSKPGNALMKQDSQSPKNKKSYDM